MDEEKPRPDVPEGSIWYIEENRVDSDGYIFHAPGYERTELHAETLDLLLEERRPGGWCGPTAQIYFSLGVVTRTAREQYEAAVSAVDVLLDDLGGFRDMLNPEGE